MVKNRLVTNKVTNDIAEKNLEAFCAVDQPNSYYEAMALGFVRVLFLTPPFDTDRKGDACAFILVYPRTCYSTRRWRLANASQAPNSPRLEHLLRGPCRRTRPPCR